MARIELRGISHHYAPTEGRGGRMRRLPWGRPGEVAPEALVLEHMDLVWEHGVAYALLGPSGCGKTTLLNIISGLLSPVSGSVLIDGQDVTDRPPQARNIAQVFQFPVVYDTMRVFDNLAFPLRNRGVPEERVRERVREVAAMLELTPDLPRRASGLGADAKQKISLGRGLVRDDVAAILFDEPLTVIDPHLRWLLRRKLREIHERLDVTMIYVTHDQNEALTFADEVVVMSEGKIVQAGTPEALFERPAHTFVGYFIGSPGMNFLPCTLSDQGLRVGEQTLGTLTVSSGRAGEGRLELGIRPEHARIATGPGPCRLRARVTGVEDLGTHCMVTLEVEGRTVHVKTQALPPAGEELFLELAPEHTRIYRDGRLVQ